MSSFHSRMEDYRKVVNTITERTGNSEIFRICNFRAPNQILIAI